MRYVDRVVYGHTPCFSTKVGCKTCRSCDWRETISFVLPALKRRRPTTHRRFTLFLVNAYSGEGIGDSQPLVIDLLSRLFGEDEFSVILPATNARPARTPSSVTLDAAMGALRSHFTSVLVPLPTGDTENAVLIFNPCHCKQACLTEYASRSCVEPSLRKRPRSDT